MSNTLSEYGCLGHLAGRISSQLYSGSALYPPRRTFLMARAKAPARRPLVRVEQLEDRTAPALFTQLTPQTSTQLANNGFVASGDWNKDGFQDVVMANYGNPDGFGGVIPGKTITFAYGNGTGTFGSFSSQAVGPGND